MAVVSFETIGNGGLAEQFRMALALVGRNIMDPNMDPKKPRKVNIEITFTPTGGGAMNTEYKVKPDLAGFAKGSTTFLIGQDLRTGKIQMNEYGSVSTPMKIDAGPQMTQAETVPPQPFDPETGEILGEPVREYKGPIDLRAAK